MEEIDIMKVKMVPFLHPRKNCQKNRKNKLDDKEEIKMKENRESKRGKTKLGRKLWEKQE